MSNSPVSLSASKKWWLFIFSFLYLLPELLFAFTTNYVTFAYRFFTLALSTSLFLLLLALLRNYVKVFVVIGFILTLFLGSVAISTALFYDAKINISSFAALMNTNPEESKEFILGYMGTVITAVLIVLILFVMILRFIPAKTGNAFARKSVLIALVLCFVSSFYFVIEKKMTPVRYVKSYIYKEVYPVYFFKTFSVYIRENNRLKENLQLAKSFSFHATTTSSDSVKNIFVLVIGESSRSANWSAYGYSRATTPLLDKRNNVALFSDAISSHNSTMRSVTINITPVGAANFEDHSKYRSIMQLFREVGYKTYWLSNQNDFSAAIVRIHMMDADSVSCTTGSSDVSALYDEVLLPPFIQLASQNNNAFFVVHLNGNHWNYGKRYPKQFEKFGNADINNVDRTEYFNVKDKQNITNTYDNSILYQDYILDRLMTVLDTMNKPSCLLYVSDHGEDLFDDCRNKIGHGASFSSAQFKVPMFLYVNKVYDWQNPNTLQMAIANKDKKIIAGENIFYTLAQLAHINYPMQNLKQSIVANEFEEQQKRMVLLPDNSVAAFEDLIKEESKQIEKCK